MTNEEKQILLADLCARLPYGVKCYAYQFKIDGNDCECCGTLAGINNGYFHLSDRTPVNGGKTYDEYYLEVKPYLRPMSSMTHEEYGQYMEFIEWSHNDYDATTTSCINKELLHEYMDFIYSHHLDDNNFIEKGLALEAPEDMYKED